MNKRNLKKAKNGVEKNEKKGEIHKNKIAQLD